MTFTFSATNPCHMYDLAVALHHHGALSAYHSGYPRWRLPGCPEDLPLRAHSRRTLVTYGALKFLPRSLRPSDHRLFRWQDEGFDRRVASTITDAEVCHALPGQCEHTFIAAKARGIRTVLNHATGPTRDLEERVRAEFDRVGLPWQEYTPYDSAFREREDREWALADRHCVASSEVRTQLIARGVDAPAIQVVPYGANPARFHPPSAPLPARSGLRILFAGQLSLRKGLRVVWEALEDAPPGWRMDHYGPLLPEMQPDWNHWKERAPLHHHGPVGQDQLGERMREADVLVLPSLEEGFGLVVVQALSCGLPCLVSERVGARDLIQPGINGDLLPVDTPAEWTEALHRWQGREHASRSLTQASWEQAASTLVQDTEAWLS